ncbi:MAG: TRAP transporter substrate-binding protein DctP [Rhodospirillales bacterium]|nr:TRAP transporter substrate-binding protein DctP [Rhodospirillales bacterium]
MSYKISKLAFAAAISAGAVLGGITAPTPAKAATELLFNVFVPPKHPFNTGMFIPWAKDVMRVTEGRVKVSFTTATLAPPPKQWNMISKGIADVAMLANIFERNRLTMNVIGDLPFLGDSAVHRGVALWRTHKKFFEKANEYKGVKLLGLWTISGAHLFHGKKPIRAVSDLNKEKMWVIAGLPNKMIASLGAVVVSVPGVKMFNVVSKGIVNGKVTSPYGMNAFKTMPYIKHITKVPGGVSSVTFSLLLNKKKWDSMSKKDQELVMSVSGETIARNAGKKTDQLDAKALKMAKAKGITYETASPAFVKELKEKLAFASKGWVANAAKKGVDGNAALAYYRQQVAAQMK